MAATLSLALRGRMTSSRRGTFLGDYMGTSRPQFTPQAIPVVDLRKVIESAAIPVRLAAVGRISVHLTASYLTFGQIAADSVTKGPTLPRGVSYEDAM